jgi:hypothetical protein
MEFRMLATSNLNILICNHVKPVFNFMYLCALLKAIPNLIDEKALAASYAIFYTNPKTSVYSMDVLL